MHQKSSSFVTTIWLMATIIVPPLSIAVDQHHKPNFFPTPKNDWSQESIILNDAITGKVCENLQKTSEKILLFGVTRFRILLITSEHFVFDLPPDKLKFSSNSASQSLNMLMQLPLPQQQQKLDHDSAPPLYMTIDQQPVHFRDRWPKSYKKFLAISHRLVQTFIITVNNGTTEYAMFVYQRVNDNADANVETCALGLDITNDRLVTSLCSDALAKYLFVQFATNNVPSSSSSTSSVISIELQATPIQSDSLCFFMSTFLRHHVSLSNITENNLRQLTCTDINVENCTYLLLPDEQDEFLPCIPLGYSFTHFFHLEFMSKIFFYNFNDNMLHMWISLQQYHTQMTEFFSCYEQEPIVLSLNAGTLMLIIFFGTVLELIICCALYKLVKLSNTDIDYYGGAGGAGGEIYPLSSPSFDDGNVRNRKSKLLSSSSIGSIRSSTGSFISNNNNNRQRKSLASTSNRSRKSSKSRKSLLLQSQQQSSVAASTMGGRRPSSHSLSSRSITETSTRSSSKIASTP